MDLKLIKQWQKYLPVQNHSDFQIKHFIIGNEMFNEYGGFVQSVREIYSRINNIQSNILEYKKEEITLKELQDKLNKLSESKEENKYEIERTLIEIEQQRLKLSNLESMILAHYSELKKFYMIAEHLYEKVKDKNIKELEADYWKKRLWTIFKLGDYSADKKSAIKSLMSMGNNEILNEIDRETAQFLKQTNLKPINIELNSEATIQELNAFLSQIPELKGGDDNG